ncbi:MAG: hypothetical protein OJF49_001941 [Ktedonobacterales bacterium]|jgi:Mrp family chromosome partitioning ATPase|nr:MAG: hypothetical protein OJF49_001941 [Ktedonobacterales bacterium]
MAIHREATLDGDTAHDDDDAVATSPRGAVRIVPSVPSSSSSTAPDITNRRLSGHDDKDKAVARPRTDRDAANSRFIQEQCRKLCLSVFFRESSPVRSIGFTSALGGEGKTFVALTTASILANDSADPVTYIECNWEHPTIHDHFNLPPSPGLAEWLRQEASEAEVRHQVAPNLTVIPAGNARDGAVKLLRLLREKSTVGQLSGTQDLVVVELPPIVSCSYGPLAASIVESLIVVVRSGATPEPIFAEACSQLKNLPVEGVLLNQVRSRIPAWLRRIL